MEIVNNIAELQSAVACAKKSGQTIGLVPTMGCLHEGHLNLIRRAKKESDFVIVSIFVNPTQFGPNEDFRSYPHTFKEDCQGCEAAGANLIFAPSTEVLYPQGASTWIEVEGPSTGLCGDFRPGHFRGVATVVAMLFNLTQADLAIFGRKDMQQLAVIRKMVRDLHFRIRIICHETIREPNGLAMSSRNRYLTREELQISALIPTALQAAKALADSGVTDTSRMLDKVQSILSINPAIRVQYCEVVDLMSMSPVSSIYGRRCAIAIACHIGTTRLIDNLELGLSETKIDSRQKQ